jgi:hypothetical protein
MGYRVGNRAFGDNTLSPLARFSSAFFRTQVAWYIGRVSVAARSFCLTDKIRFFIICI